VKLLLDTHAFLWWDSEPAKLPRRVKELCQDPQNEVMLSVVSVWEMQVKSRLGKLELRSSLARIVGDQQERNGIIVLPVTLTHTLALESLPMHHKDPFDRLLIAQAQVEGATLLSRDGVFSAYPVQVIWS
jgi:PIN domain nuclease of toxin-antitoxin system